MRILVAGDGHSELHELPVCSALKKLGHDVNRFFWYQYFTGAAGAPAPIRQILNRFQNKFLVGPIIDRLNADLLTSVEKTRPELVFIYRGTHIKRETVRAIKQRLPSAVVIGYNNDDPFAQGHPFWLWRHFLASLAEYDLMLAYRHHNVEEFLRAGAKRVRLLRSWFVPERNYPVSLSSEEQFQYGCDVVFVGHYEADQRVEYLEEVVKQGFSLKLYGHGYAWDPVIAKSPWLRQLSPVRLVWGEDYNKALCGAKVALCFLSKLNRDTYTRRCFEIPATKTLMLSEYSEDLTTLYKEGAEADFFRSKIELIQKLKAYVTRDLQRDSVAQAGHQRVIADGHDVVSRMRQVSEWAAELLHNEGLACV
jgi:spore maturation protein CgeB